MTPLCWDGVAYEVGESDGVASPPRNAIWLESLESPETETAGTLTSRIFRRAKGPITCRANCVGGVASLLTLIRHNYAKLVVPADTTSISTEAPSIHLRHHRDLPGPSGTSPASDRR